MFFADLDGARRTGRRERGPGGARAAGRNAARARVVPAPQPAHPANSGRLARIAAPWRTRGSLLAAEAGDGTQLPCALPDPGGRAARWCRRPGAGAERVVRGDQRVHRQARRGARAEGARGDPREGRLGPSRRVLRDAASHRDPAYHLRPRAARRAQAQDHPARDLRPRPLDLPVLRAPPQPDGGPRDPALEGRPVPWDNIVTCCAPCNRRKGDRLPGAGEHGAGATRPRRPGPTVFIHVATPTIPRRGSSTWWPPDGRAAPRPPGPRPEEPQTASGRRGDPGRPASERVRASTANRCRQRRPAVPGPRRRRRRSRPHPPPRAYRPPRVGVARGIARRCPTPTRAEAGGHGRLPLPAAPASGAGTSPPQAKTATG